ncbi:MAG TPA: type III PLP-dependent enzyme [Rickettsiales bacterium]|nr:type III PLP-dependent enzyme [Rickettsiales bacterium]
MDNETFDPDGCLNQQENSADSKVKYVDFQKSKHWVKNILKSGKNPRRLTTIKENITSLKPSVPVYFVRPHALQKAAAWFLSNFAFFQDFAKQNYQGEVLYSVKSNPDEIAMQYLFDAGIKQFDVASLHEIRLVKKLFGDEASMYYMHPVKPRESIAEAYFEHNIRDFSLDSVDELKKILDATGNAKDLGLHLRIAIPNSHSAIDLSGKFGVHPAAAVSLIRKIKASAARLGVCFHVGSQCMDPSQYRSAMMIVKEIVHKAKVHLDVLDVGGGFPSTYPGMTPPDLQSYVDEIRDSIMQMNLPQGCRIWCEPGRALVAESGSLLVRVEGRKGNMLYINDGTYGGLFDAGFPGFIYPTKAFRTKRGTPLMSEQESFGFFGPTCDSLDIMHGPFYLPKNINEGDYIEIGQLGAYSKSIRTDFNGFNDIIQIEVCDEPLSSVYVNLAQNHQEQSQKQ